MPYCTLQELTDRYGETMLLDLSDRGGAPAEEIDAVLVARAIADADALIDGYLTVRYALPLPSVPRLVKDLSLRVTIYYAHAHIAGEKIKEDYQAALKTLRDLSAGVVRLDVEGVEPAASGASEVRTNDPHRPFSSDSMKGWI